MVKRQRFWSPQEFLEFWQECHGNLSAKWQEKFLKDPRIIKISSLEVTESVLVAIKRNKKIDNVLKDIEGQIEKHEEFLRKQNRWYDSISDAPAAKPFIYEGWIKWGGRWKKY